MGALYRDRVWENKTLKGGRLLVMLALADHADAAGECYPGMAVLMDKTRLTDRQLRRVLNTLHADGLISIEERAIGRGKRPHYKLFPHEKADIITEKKADILSDQKEKADIFDNKSGHFVHEKADILGAKQSHARREPTTEPKTEPGESAPARIASPREPASKELRHKSPHLDPRHFVNGYIPPGAGVNAVEVYYERFSINQDAARLNAIKEDDLNRLCPDLDKLRSVIVAYSRTTFQPGNVQLILDWYSGGIPDKHKPPGQSSNTNGAMSEEKKNFLKVRANQARKSLESATKFKTGINPQWQQDIDAAKAAGVI